MQIVARITSDAHITKTKSGKELVSFTAAIKGYYKPKNGEGVQLTTIAGCAYWLSTVVTGHLFIADTK